MLEVLPYVDIAFLGILDFINILEYRPQEEKNYEAKLADFYKELFEKYPNIKVVNIENDRDFEETKAELKKIIQY